MGFVLSKYEYQSFRQQGLPQLVIHCFSDEDIMIDEVPLNLSIAERLAMVEPSKRSFRLPGIFDDVVGALPSDSIICDFDVLFNPAYSVDVLQMLVTACRKRLFSVIWPGTFLNGQLVYAAPGFADFTQYDIKKYDVTCII